MMSKNDKDLLNELLSPAELDVIMHALAAGRAERTGRKPKAYRNYFCASRGHADWRVIQGLVGRGLMADNGKVPLAPYTNFAVTEAGAQAAGMELPKDG